jgi:hypothetical protein
MNFMLEPSLVKNQQQTMGENQWHPIALDGKAD